MMIDSRNEAAAPEAHSADSESQTVGGSYVTINDKEVFIHQAPQVYEKSPPGLEPLPQAPGATYQEYYQLGLQTHGNYTGSGAYPTSAYTDSAVPHSAHTYDKPDASNANTDAQEEVRRYKKKLRWVCVICVFVVIALAVGLGVGLGVGRSNTHQDSNPGAAQNSSASQTPSPAAAAAAVTYTTLQSPETTLSTWGTSVECPGANGTVFVDPDTKLRFLRLCMTDYGGGAAGEDIMQTNATTMEQCMVACAGMRDEARPCQTVTWLWGPQGSYSNYCWIKAGTRGSPAESDIAESAVVLED